MNPAVNRLTPTDGLTLRENATLAPGVYFLPNGLTVAADNVTLDGGGATLIGLDREGIGVRLNGRSNVALRNLHLRDYGHGIAATNCKNLTIEKNQITSTGELPANTLFLDIWLDADKAYGGAILLDRVTDARIDDNDIQHQMCGLLTYHCSRLQVRRNLANYNSGYGLHLFDTSDSVFEGNYADYCCRWEPRDKKPRDVMAAQAWGHMGADATGFLIVQNSCRNVFRDNYARLGGDGFFLAGLRADPNDPFGKTFLEVPCNDNLFEGNDGSYSPNIAFEATFSARNVFRNNKAYSCGYGFWLGFSSDNTLENNRIVHNRQGGIAVENGARFVARGNQLERNHVAGILLWSKFVEPWFTQFPENRTIHHWRIENNVLTGNGAGVAILADKDHGVRPMPPEACGKPETRPHENALTGNNFQDNRIGIDLCRADRTLIEKNTIHRNVECNIRQDDAAETMIRNNLGLYGAYL